MAARAISKPGAFVAIAALAAVVAAGAKPAEAESVSTQSTLFSAQSTVALQPQTLGDTGPGRATAAVALEVHTVSAETRTPQPETSSVTATSASASSTAAEPRSSSTTSLDPSDAAVWDRLAQCEASGNWNIDTGNGYYGGLQFSQRTWAAYGGTGSAADATREQQIEIGKRVQASQGWGAWPSCTKKMGASS